MNKKLAISLLVALLLFAVAGVAYAAWQDTLEAQATATLLPAPEDTFSYVSSGCQEAVVGFGNTCYMSVRNDSSSVMTIGVFTVTTTYEGVTVHSFSHDLGGIDPGQNGGVFWQYLSAPTALPGVVTFDVEITCTGD